MAKRECPLCKEKVKEDALKCKHCQSELPPLPPKKWYRTWKGLLFIFLGVGLMGNVIGGLSKNSTSTPSGLRTTFTTSPNVVSKQASDTVGAKKREDFAISMMTTYQARGSDLIMNATGEDYKTLMCWSKEFNRSFIRTLMKEGFADAPKSVGFTSIEFYKDPSTHIISYDLTTTALAPVPTPAPPPPPSPEKPLIIPETQSLAEKRESKNDVVIGGKPPEEIIIKDIQEYKPPVVFSHKNHENRADCQKCHHKNDSGKEEKCSVCHKNKFELKKAFHKNCSGCHFAVNKDGKTTTMKCVYCHKR